MSAYIAPIHPSSGIHSAVCLNLFPGKQSLIVSKSNRLEFYNYTSIAQEHTQNGDISGHNIPPQAPLTLVQTYMVYGRITSLTRLGRSQPHSATPTSLVSATSSSNLDRLLVTTDRLVLMVVYFSLESGFIEVEQVFTDLGDRSAQESQYGHRIQVDSSGRFVHLSMLEGISTIFPISQPHGSAGSSNSMVGSSKKKSGQQPLGTLVGPLHCRIRQMNVLASVFVHPATQTSTGRSPNGQPRLAILYEAYSAVTIRILRLAYLPGSDSRDDNGSIELLDFEDDGLGRPLPGGRSTEGDATAHLLIPVTVAPFGILVLSQTNIVWIDSNDMKNKIQLPLPEATVFTTWTQLNDTTYALADEYCNLFILQLDLSEISPGGRGPVDASQISWSVVKAGETTRSDALVTMPDPDHIFVGSHHGDSMLVKVSDSTRLEVVQTLPGLAPILDFAVLDLGKGISRTKERYNLLSTNFSSGQAGMVVGSGSWQDGCLSFIRRGVYWKEQAVLPQLSLASRLFPLHEMKGAGKHHDVLAVSLPDSTLLLKFDQNLNSLTAITSSGLDLNNPTLLARDLPSGHVLQVTSGGAVICDLMKPRSRAAEWAPPIDSDKISIAKATSQNLLLAYGGSSLAILSLQPNEYLRSVVLHTFPEDDQISSIDIRGNLIFVGSWMAQSITPVTFQGDRLEFGSPISLLPILRQLEPEMKIEGGGTDPGWFPIAAVPRDICLARYTASNSVLTALVALDFGAVLIFDFTTESESSLDIKPRNQRIMKFGSLSARFELGAQTGIVESDGVAGDSVLVLSDYMGLLVSDFSFTDHCFKTTNSKLVYSLVNDTEGVLSATFFSPPGFPNSVAMATPKGIVIGEIGNRRAQLVSPLKMHETIRRLSYNVEDGVIALGTVARKLRDREEVLSCRVVLADEAKGRELDSYPLRDAELIESVVWADLPSAAAGTSGDSIRSRSRYCLIGTTCVHATPGRPSSSSSTLGRLILLEVSPEKKWRDVSTVLFQGGCRCIAIAGDFVVAGLTKTIVLFGIHYSSSADSKPVLKRLSSYRSSSTTIEIITNRYNPKQIAVLDLMKSVHILEIVPVNEVPSMTMQRPFGPEDDETHTFVVVGVHSATVVGTAMGQLDENLWMTADADGNLRLVTMPSKKDATNLGGAKATRRGLDLDLTGALKIGEMVNCVRQIEQPLKRDTGSDLVGGAEAVVDRLRQQELFKLGLDFPVQPRVLFATVDGSIYMIGLIAPEQVGLLSWLQYILAEVIYFPFRLRADGTFGSPLSGSGSGSVTGLSHAGGVLDGELDGDAALKTGTRSPSTVTGPTISASASKDGGRSERLGEMLVAAGLTHHVEDIKKMSQRLRSGFLIGAGMMMDFFKFRAVFQEGKEPISWYGTDRVNGSTSSSTSTTATTNSRDVGTWNSVTNNGVVGSGHRSGRKDIRPRAPVWNFVDGELVERYLDLPEEMQELVVELMNVGVSDEIRRTGGGGEGVVDEDDLFTVTGVGIVVERLARLR